MSKWHLEANGLDPAQELERHEKMAAQYRSRMASMGRKRNWIWRDLLASATYHEESAARLKREGVCL